MFVDVFGVQLVDFSNLNGDVIKGTNLFVAYPYDGVVGLRTDKLFIKQSIDCSRIKTGDRLDISFNRYGKVDSLNIVKE